MTSECVDNQVHVQMINNLEGFILLGKANFGLLKI